MKSFAPKQGVGHEEIAHLVPAIVENEGAPVLVRALARVFVLANQTNTAQPDVQFTLYNNGSPVTGYPKTVSAPSAAVPTAVDESRLSASWNLAIDAWDLAAPVGTGYRLDVMVDPSGRIAETDRTNNLVGAALGASSVPVFRTTIFPVNLSGRTGNITAANRDTWVGRLVKMYPVAGVDVAADLVADRAAHVAALVADCEVGQVEGVEDQFDAASNEGGIDFVGVAVKGYRRGLGQDIEKFPC